MLNRPKPLMPLVLDGFGFTSEQNNNAIAMLGIPCWGRLQEGCPIWASTMLAILGVGQPLVMTRKPLLKAA
ncbi:hypothetical protein [Methylovulum sp.]|uniref:hypothetical protein n=1 Tax=Methylovulum sp. TaxID=1916980 RepID=UPI002629477C|nr:hypothetical protein [Methylovulum sp.]